MRSDMLTKQKDLGAIPITDKIVQRILDISKEMQISDIVMSREMGISSASFVNYFRYKKTIQCRRYIFQKIETFIKKYDAKKAAEEAEKLKLEQDGNK